MATSDNITIDDILEIMSGSVKFNTQGGGSVNLGNIGKNINTIEDRKLDRQAKKMQLEQQRLQLQEYKDSKKLRDAMRESDLYKINLQRGQLAKAKVQQEQQNILEDIQNIRKSAVTGEEFYLKGPRYSGERDAQGNLLKTKTGQAYDELAANNFRPTAETILSETKAAKLKKGYALAGPLGHAIDSMSKGPLTFFSEALNPFTQKKEQINARFVRDPINPTKWLLDENLYELADMEAMADVMLSRRDIFTEQDRMQLHKQMSIKKAKIIQDQDLAAKVTEEAVKRGLTTPEEANRQLNLTYQIDKYVPDYSTTFAKMTAAAAEGNFPKIWQSLNELGGKMMQKRDMSTWYSGKVQQQELIRPELAQGGEPASVYATDPVKSAKLKKNAGINQRRQYRQNKGK
jgi:hypothetical protein